MPDRPFTIRLARAGEAEAIRGLVRRAYAIYVPRLGKEPGPMRDDYAKRVADGAAHVLETNGAIAGILVLLAAVDRLLMDNVAVDPDFQGRGYASALVGFAEREAARRGYPELTLYTHVTMTENLAMYAHLGYEETHRVTEKGYERVYMRKTLDGYQPEEK